MIRPWLCAAISLSLSVHLGSLAEAYEFKLRPDIYLVQSGASYSGGIITPIWAINSGNTLTAEKLAFARSQRFGPYGLDATMWVRDAQRGGSWKEVTYVFPGRDYNIEDEALILALPAKFRSEKYVENLPRPLSALPAGDIDMIDFVIVYNVGGAKVYLKTETTTDGALQIFDNIGRAIKMFLGEKEVGPESSW